MRYDPTIYKELQKIRDRIPRNTYKTILGQLRAGDMIGAAMGVKRLQRQLARADKEGGESMKYKVCPNCGAHLDPAEHCDCETKHADKQPKSAGEYADKPTSETPKKKPDLMPGA